MKEIHISKAKSLAGNFKISHAILCVIFSILFIFTALNISIQAYAYPVEDTTTANGLGNMHYDSEKHKWVYDASYGESGEDGIDIPENIGNDVINGTKTTGSVAPSYTYWAGDSHRCGVICYVIDLTTNTRDTTYTPFILVNNFKDSNKDPWKDMVNATKFFLRTGDALSLSQTKGVYEEEDIAPVLYAGDGWSSNGSGVESVLLTEDATYKYMMFRYWSAYGGLSDTQLNQLAQDISNGKKALAWETVSAQSLFTSGSKDSYVTLHGMGTYYDEFIRTGDVSANHDGLPVKAFTTEYGFAKWVNKQGLSGLSGSIHNWKWFQATAGSMILEEDEAGIIKPTGNTTIGTITASETATITNGYGILITKITLPPLHTYDSSKGTPGNTQTPDSNDGTDGACTIKKLYYTQELSSDGTILTEAKDYHPYTQTSTTAYISIDTESDYEIEGWKTSTTNTTLNTKEQFNSITPIHTGTSSQEILLDQDNGEKYLYILYKKTEVNPNPSQPYDFQLQQSQITKRVSFITPDANSTTQQLFTHNFTWTAPAPTITTCQSHGGYGHHLNCSKTWDTEPVAGTPHTHTSTCYKFICTNTSSLHTHTDSCYSLTCTKEWDTAPVAGVPHTHTNTCYDTPCTSFTWTDNTTSLGITLDTSSLNKAVVSKNDSITYNQPAVNTITSSNKYNKDNTSTRSGTSQNTQSISNFNYITVLFRGQDHLTLADWKNGGAISYLTNLAYPIGFIFLHIFRTTDTFKIQS